MAGSPGPAPGNRQVGLDLVAVTPACPCAAERRHRCPRRSGPPWTGSWTGASDNPSAVSAVSAMIRVVCAASGYRAWGMLGGVSVALPAVAWFVDDPEAVSAKIMTTLRSLDGKPASPGGTLSRSSPAGA